MSAQRFAFELRGFGFALVALLGLAATGRPQPPGPLIPPDPQAPTLNMAVPLGMQRGTTLELTLTGTNLADPVALWTSFPAKVTIPTDKDNGKDNAKLRVVLEVPKDAPLGFHGLRLATKRGISNLRLFCVDDLPQLMEVDTNRSKTTAQPVPVPSVVVGRADAEVSDYFKISAKAGQRVSFEILGRRLGSALDPQLSLYDVRTGRELAFDNDAPGLQTDARLTYTFKDAGDYLIEVRDVMYRGGADHWYRLRIGDFPCATTPIPMAAKRGGKVQVKFAGPTVDGVPPVEVTVPTDPAVHTLWVAPKGANGLYGWPVALDVSDTDEVVEVEPNNEPAKATRVPVPGGVTGRLEEKGDIDYFVFAAKKGQRLILEAHTQELNSPTVVDMVLKDAKGALIAATDPKATPRLDFTAPADGDFYLSVEHAYSWSGPSESYHVTITPYEPGFDLSLGIDRYGVPQGAAAVVSVLAVRRDYAGPIDVSVVGHPGITGQAVIQAGHPLAPGQPAALLFISARPDVPLGAYDIAIQGKATINGKAVVSMASVRPILSRDMANLPYPPRHLNTHVAVGVAEKPPFTLVAKLDQPEVLRGGPVGVTITAARAAGFMEDIVLAPPYGLPPNVVPALKNIAKGQNEVKVQLTTNPATPLGDFPIAFIGRAKFQNRDYAVHAPPVSLVLTLPFTLQTEPALLKLMQGGKAKVKVTAVRKAGYQGPIAVELRNLPANVTASKATIAMGQSAAEIEVTAAANAAPGDKADVNAFGTATAAANQPNASPNFTVSVLAVPFDLKVEPPVLKLVQGGKGKIKVTAVRKTYQGPISIELRNLPAYVDAQKSVIPMGQTAVEIEVAAGAAAAVGDKADVQALGTATAMGNQQNASPNFAVSVVKK
jgi:hypothetical protein